MRVVILEEQQVCEIYMRYIREAFPASELKPYWKIQDSIRRDGYLCYGMLEEDELVAYAFFMKAKSDQEALLLDYYAVVPQKRNRGYGSKLLRLLEDIVPQAILSEVENPAKTTDPKERETQLRRIAFYEKNGFVDIGVRCEFYGVYYRILGKGFIQSDATSENIRRIKGFYRKVYHRELPKKKLRFWPAKRSKRRIAYKNI